MESLAGKCWKAACEKAGFVGNGSPAAQIEATIEPLSGAEFTAVNALLSEAGNRCLSLDVDGAAEHLRLAAAMVEQRGRVLGALRAAEAVEEALWPDEAHVVAPQVNGPHGDGSADFAVEAANRLAVNDVFQLDVVRILIANGFGPQPEGAK